MIAALCCPVCAAGLRQDAGGGVVVCVNGHGFDVARQGYVHLGTGRRLPEGDTAAMVEARAAVLGEGLFAPLSEALARTVPVGAHLIVDLGAGTGHYLRDVLDARPHATGLAFDVSKPALRRAARVHPRLGAVLADTWGTLPLRSGGVDVLLNVFAPRNGAQMARVLAPHGVLIVAAPLPHHLAELREACGLLEVDRAKEERLSRTLRDFERVGEEHVEWSLRLDERQATRLVAMGPNAFHGRIRAAAMTVGAAVSVTTWRGRPPPTRPERRDAGR